MAKILYIEDIPDNAMLAQRLFTGRGHEFLWAQTAEDGLAMANAAPPGWTIKPPWKPWNRIHAT